MKKEFKIRALPLNNTLKASMNKNATSQKVFQKNHLKVDQITNSFDQFDEINRIEALEDEINEESLRIERLKKLISIQEQEE